MCEFSISFLKWIIIVCSGRTGANKIQSGLLWKETRTGGTGKRGGFRLMVSVLAMRTFLHGEASECRYP